jgi:hypothetical protein
VQLSRPTADCFERVAEAVRTRELTQVAPPRKTAPCTILIRKGWHPSAIARLHSLSLSG